MFLSTKTFQVHLDRVEEDWGFDELKIIRELAMAAVDAEDKVAEVTPHMAFWL